MKLKYIAAFAFAVALASCDILDKEPSDSWDSGSAIQTVDDLKYAINGVYETQTGIVSQYGNYTGDFGLYADLKGSDYMCIGNNNQATEISKYQATPTGNLPKAIYKLFYKSIARVNKIMEQAQASGLQGEEVNGYLGELYALRALFHFDLARVYAQLPTVVDDVNSAMGIVLATKTLDYTFVPERATLAETYKTILSDVNKAVELMEPVESTHNKNATTGHMNYWAALALRARVSLYLDNVNVNGTTEHNKQALADAKKVIEEGPYKLYTLADYTSVWAKEFTDESIFEFQTTAQYNPQRNSLGYYTDPTGYAEAGMSESFVKEFIGDEATYEYKDKDVRVSAGMILKESDGGDNEAYYTQKYPGRDGQIYVNNARVFRLSEMYLIAAEAASKTSDGTSADKYINDLRKQRIADYVDVSGVTRDDILKERRLELNGEGHMAWDMWRNGKSVNNKEKGEVKPGADMAVFPIPQANINASHGALKQNPGF